MRSLLFVPAHDERKLAKGQGAGADALIVDLEDAVPEAEKASARVTGSAFVRTSAATMRLFVRINGLSTPHAQADLDAVVPAAPYGVMLPKCEGAGDLVALSELLAAREEAAGLTVGSIRILPIVTETAAGVLALASYGQLPAGAKARLCGLMWGGEDLAADIGAVANKDAEGRYTAPYQLARTLTLLGATAAQVPAVDAVYTNFRNPEGLQAEGAEAVRDGFCAKAAIHPDQIATIHAVFTPRDEELAWARRVIAAFDAAPSAGAIALDGKMLDRPHYRSAQRLLTRAGQA